MQFQFQPIHTIQDADNKKIILSSLLLFTIIFLIIILSFGNKNEITISCTGDILFDRGVKIKLNAYGYDYPYKNVLEVLKKSDLTIGNLECPLTSAGTPVYKRSDLIFKGDTKNAKELKAAGFDVLNLANNHSMDQGREGLLNTMEALKDNNIAVVGAGLNKKDSHKPVFVTRGGVKIGILSYSCFPAEGYIFDSEMADICHFDENLLKEEIVKAKKDCDFLMVFFHHGNEYDFYPSEIQKKYSHTAIDNGADIVVGNHPHVLQGAEKYNGKYIFYSLGNFIFDRQAPFGTNETIILELTLKNKKLSEIDAIPVKIIECQPTLSNDKSNVEILNNFIRHSEGMGVNFKIEENIIKIK